MQTVRYAIHNLINVLVDSRVNESVIEQIDFQIEYFKTTGDQSPAPQKIIVKPYCDFAVDPALMFDTFHLVRGITGEIMDNPERRIAIRKEQNAFTICTDTPFLINFYIQLLLIEPGIALVHAAAVADRKGRITLFPGAGGVGKTALLGYMVKQKDYRTLGDDIICITQDGECLSFPRSFVLKDYHQEVYPEIFKRLNLTEKTAKAQRPYKHRLLQLIKENVPFKGVTKSVLRRLNLLDKIVLNRSTRPYLAAVSVEDVLGKDSVSDRGTLERVIYLQRYAGNQFRFAPVAEDVISRRMFAIIQHEWVEIMRELFTLSAIEIVNLEAYFHRVAEIMKLGISDRQCEMLWIPDNASPEALWQYFSSHLGFE